MSRRDPAASIRQRLLDRARTEDRPFQELLQYYAMERFLYRLAESPHRDRFVLKGALLLTAWRSPQTRPTKDIDLEGQRDNDPEAVTTIIREICTSGATDDGIDFDPDSVTAERITEDAEYEGVRVRLRGSLAKARITMQVDVAFGDTIVPGPEACEYPTILDLPAPVLPSYPKESVVAEKLEAITVLGMLNSRLKDYFDVWLLSRLYAFDGDLLARAVSATFRNRGTQVEGDPIGLGEAFGSDPARVRQWNAFRRRSRLDMAPVELRDLVLLVRDFAEPVLSALATQTAFARSWRARGPWSDR